MDEEFSAKRGRNVINYKWVYKFKRKAAVDWYKARLIAKGFKQQ
jgi:hypothetical protein